MKKLLVILVIFVFSNFSFANDANCVNIEALPEKSAIVKYYEKLVEERKYRFKYEVKKAMYDGQLELVKYHYRHIIYRRYNNNRYYRGYKRYRRYSRKYNYPYRIYSVRACP